MCDSEPDALLHACGWDLTADHGCFALTLHSTPREQLPPEAAGRLPDEHQLRNHINVERAVVLVQPLPPGPGAGAPR